MSKNAAALHAVPAAPSAGTNLSTSQLFEATVALLLAVPAAGDPSLAPAEVIWGIPTLVWGPPGIGKTSRLRRVAQMLGLAFGYTLPSTKAPEDFGGVPVQDGQGGLKLAVTLGAARELAGKAGLWLVDEMTTSGRAVMHALLGVTLERLVGDLYLGGRCRVVGAANSAQDAGGADLTAPLANRFCHLSAPIPSADEWGAYLIGGEEPLAFDLSRAEAQVEAGWGDAWAKARALFAAFARKRPELLHKVPAEGSPDRTRAYCTPRSLEAACRVYATALVLGVPEQVRDIAIEGLIGNATSSELLGYLADMDLPEPRDVIAGKVDGVFAQRIDRTHAVVDAVTATVVAAKKPTNVDLAKGAWGYLDKVMEAGMADLVPTAVASLSRAGLAIGNKAIDPVSAPVLQKLHRSGVQKV